MSDQRQNPASRCYIHPPAKLSLHPLGLVAVVILASLTLQAQNFNVLSSLTGSDGSYPLYINLYSEGNLYGTTYYGGLYGDGVVFRLSQRGSGWLMTTLFNFSGQNDGGSPYSGVVTGPDGSLYGTTEVGGRYGYGLVYKLQPPPTPCKAVICYWMETVLYNFTGYSDGSGPQGNLLFDQAGNIYGTAIYGGSDFGTLWKLTPSQGQWSLTMLHTFTGASDGSHPVGGVIRDQSGNLYGVASSGGTYGAGVAYEVSYGGSGWTETVLHSFGNTNDGEYPSGLISDAQGNLYGFTTGGGSSAWGTAYEFQLSEGGFSYHIIYTFEPNLGAGPELTNLPTLHAGNLYGAATTGGNGRAGAVFELTPSGGSWNFLSLHDFTGPDGGWPAGSPLLDAAGNLYGVTEVGGAHDQGVVWEITP